MLHAVVPVDDASRVAEARRIGRTMAMEEGLNEAQVANVALIATEAATNLLKHAKSGELHFARLFSQGLTGLDIISIDHGPGMADLDRCLRDGFSTSGTQGTGLGAIVRVSSTFDAFTLHSGTVLISRTTGEDSPVRQHRRFQLAAVSKPIRGEELCGDAWSAKVSENGIQVLVADGLGHGLRAAEASAEAVAAFRRTSELSPLRVLEIIHAALRGTRGAAVAIASLDYERNVAEFAGLGNISASLVTTSRSQSMISHNGTAGHEGRRLQMFTYSLEPGATLVMHSDGLSANWDLRKYPGIYGRHVGILAGLLYRDCSRNRDDVCVVAVKPEL